MPRSSCDLHVVAEIVRRAGLDCELVPHPGSAPLVRARSRRSGSTAWTVHAGRYPTDHDRVEAFVGPAGSSQPRRLREPDERQVAALVIAQALHPDPSVTVSCDEIRALGLPPALLCT